MNRYVLGFAVAAVLVCFAGLAQAENILLNSDCIESENVWEFFGAGGYDTMCGRPHSVWMAQRTWVKNVTTHNIVVGDQFSLTFDGARTAANNVNIEAAIKYIDTVGDSQMLACETVTTSLPTNEWATFEGPTFTAESGGAYIGRPVVVEFWHSGGGTYSGIDKVYLDYTPVPEPGTLVLLATGLLGLLCYAWRKRK